MQIRLKDKEKDISNYNLKQGKKIDIHEAVFQKFNELTLFLPNNDINSLIQSIQVVQNYVNNNKLYIDSGSLKIYNEFLDYFRRLITHPYNKDVRFEAEKLDAIVKDFSRI